MDADVNPLSSAISVKLGTGNDKIVPMDVFALGLILSTALSSLSFGAESLVPSPQVSKLLKNCLTRTADSTGPARICYPDDPRAPESSPPVPSSMQGAFLDRLEEAVLSRCKHDFSQQLFASGIGPKQSTLAWAEAVVFNKQLKEPTILINADPQSGKGKGLVISLPPYSDCDDRDRIIRDLKDINEQWAILVRLSRAPDSEKSALRRALADPMTVFKVITGQDGCPDVVIHSKHGVQETSSVAQTTAAAESDPIFDAAVTEPSEATRKALETQSTNQVNSQLRNLRELASKGIRVEAEGIYIRGKRLDPSSFAFPTNALGDPNFDFAGAMEKWNQKLKALGITSMDLMNAQATQGQVQMGNLLRHRKERPLPSDQAYRYDPSGKIEVAPLPPGCEWDDRTESMVCKGGMMMMPPGGFDTGGSFFGGGGLMMGGGIMGGGGIGEIDSKETHSKKTQKKQTRPQNRKKRRLPAPF